MLNNADFVSYTWSTRLRNMTSGTEVGSNPVGVPGDENVELLEISQDKLKISLPANSCSAGHLLILNITLKRPGTEPIEAEIDAIVLGKKNIDAGQDKALLELRNPENDGWRYVLAVFQRRQDEIDDFLRNARGIN